MKNFPSTLIKQETTKNLLGNNIREGVTNIAKLAARTLFANTFGLGNYNEFSINKAFDEGYEISDYASIASESNIFSNNVYSKTRISKATINDGFDIFTNNLFGWRNHYHYEDPFKIGANVAAVVNNYKYTFSNAIPEQLESVAMDASGINDQGEGAGAGQMTVLESINVPSLFNPYASINVIGITENIPLINDENVDANTLNDELGRSFGEDNLNNFIKSGGMTKNANETESLTLNTQVASKDPTIGDCSITALVNESNKEGGGCLGLATYRYADFMYCKDVGKIPNNRLITLRRFPGPIGDNIFRSAHPKAGNAKNPARSYQDMGRLITWFDNDDNKLEDICRYNYHATWKPMTAELDWRPSEQKDEGPLDKIANFLSPGNNILAGQGFSGNNGLLMNIIGKVNILGIPTDRMNREYYSNVLLSNYDKHRIYEPPNRVWDTHKYEGKLEFSQDISLTFRYSLRSYANINPKSAFLDLIGNIQAVTYRKGSFWGGENRVYGPSGNVSVYNKANAWIDNAFDKVGGFWHAFASGSIEVSDLQEWINNAIEGAKQVVNKAVDTASDALGNPKETIENAKTQAQQLLPGIAGKVEAWNKHYHWTDALKGMVKNQLGRPAMYAFNSLLTGEAVGPWHLTIGNPKNPILVMGNLIMEDAETSHSGPLGIDDFPSEIKVVVKLKHAKSRDSIDIQKMYTKGVSSIYRSMKLVKSQNYWFNEAAFGDVKDVLTHDPMLLRKALSFI